MTIEKLKKGEEIQRNIKQLEVLIGLRVDYFGLDHKLHVCESDDDIKKAVMAKIERLKAEFDSL